MTTGIRSDASGTYGALTLGGVDKVTVGNNGIQAGSYAPDSITAAELAPGALNEQLNATGSAPTYACRAWVNFNGTGTVAIRASGNVSSITDNGTGDYTVNFATAMPDANYAVSGFANSASDARYNQVGIVTSYSTSYPPTASAFRFTVAVSYNADVFDASRISIAIFR